MPRECSANILWTGADDAWWTMMVIDSLNYLLGSHATVSSLHILHLQVAALEYRLIPTYLAQLWQNFDTASEPTSKDTPNVSVFACNIIKGFSFNAFWFSKHTFIVYAIKI